MRLTSNGREGAATPYRSFCPSPTACPTSAEAGTGAALATSSGGEEQDGGPLSGSTRDKAVAAALAEAGGGTVNEAEFAGDGGAYSVEVRLDSGRHDEIKLGENFNVIGRGADDDGARDNDGANGANGD